MAYQIADRRLTGNVYRTSRKCGKSNCHCTTNKKYWHPMYYLQYSERDKRHHIYVAKKNVKSLRAKIKYAKAKDKLRKKNYNLFISEITPIIKHLEDNPFDNLVWKSLNILAEMIPHPARLITNWKQHLAMLAIFIKFTEAIQPYLDSVSDEIEKIEELHNDILGNLQFLRKHYHKLNQDLDLDL